MYHCFTIQEGGTKMKAMKRILAMLLVVMTVGSLTVLPASAATSSALSDSVEANLPIVTYAMPLSGASRVYSYSSSSLTTRTTGYWIASYTDQIVITKISDNGKAVYVTYPSSSSSTGYRSRWFATDDILGVQSLSIYSYSATAKSTTYRMSSASAVRSYGSIAVNDGCVQLGSHTVGGKTYYPTIYPISSTKVNGVSGVKHKLAMAATNAKTAQSSQVVVSGWQWPMSGFSTTQTFNHYSTTRAKNNLRPVHCGIDMVSSDTTVRAAASGTVIYRGYSSGNGNHIVLEHTIGGVKVRTLYSHLSSFQGCPAVGKTVSKGAQIGVMGNTGNSTAAHLHFAIYTGSSTDPVGYTWTQATNKMTYGNCTFYNPSYVIQYGKLP